MSNNNKEKELNELQETIKQTITRYDIQREIADLFYKLCPNVPPQVLAATVTDTLENFKNLDNMYIGNKSKEIEYDAETLDGTRYSIEYMNEKFSNHIPRID